MKTKPIPAIVMLSAGFVTCIIAIYTHMELMAFYKKPSVSINRFLYPWGYCENNSRQEFCTDERRRGRNG